MGLLYRTKTYLVGSMQYQNGQAWREYAKKELSRIGVLAFDPYDKPFIDGIPENDKTAGNLANMLEHHEYDAVAETMRRVRVEDLRLCDLADFLIVNISPRVASWGSSEETFTANRMKKPIFMSVEGGKSKTPLWLMGTLPHKYIFDSIEDSIECLKKIDDGTIPIDNYRWKLLKPEYR